ncbi:hypothetical protein BV210_07195 [Halorientalis sp. IM1011]|uniref:hypothetical protein n=1 Tax=Halorientalis sp. IM1011 TaxID=1932360 RepID=UPI00097CCF62|nr:hypothetical protein [Halorientalis sp. IM1011]AQL42509.1 hypothetical protein BV210_07195 [Halorientalis sp. IM1011]
MTRTVGRRTRTAALGLGVLWVASLAFTTPALAQSGAGGSGGPGFWYATSLIAQVMLSIGAVGFVVQAARAYGGEIGKALYVAGGGVIVFAVWRLLDGAVKIMDLQTPGESIESTVYLVTTALLLAGFYMLWETMSEHSPA